MTEQSSVSPEPEAGSFEEIIFDQTLLRAVQALGITAPTPVQAQALPLALQGQDLVIQGKTGSGKTLTFSIPLIAHVLATSDKRVTAAIVVTPTRELTNQVHSVITALSPEIQPSCLIGGMRLKDQANALARDARIVVGTPGRILDFMRQRKLQLGQVRFFALDEADEMLSMGFLEEVTDILSALPRAKHGIFVSATITPRVEMLAKKFLTRHVTISVEDAEGEPPTIEHFHLNVGGGIMAKPEALCQVLDYFKPRSAIVFCNTKSDTELVEVVLKRRGIDAEKLNSDLTQKARNRVMDQLRSDKLRYLIATDIAARGLDVDQIDLVVNYSIHDQVETYVHRTGRTGRAGRFGRAVSLVGPQDFGSFFTLKRQTATEFRELDLSQPLTGEMEQS